MDGVVGLGLMKLGFLNDFLDHGCFVVETGGGVGLVLRMRLRLESGMGLKLSI